MCQPSSMRNICSTVYVYLYYSKLECRLSLSPLLYFASALRFFVLTTEPWKSVKRTGYSVCVVSLWGLQAPNVIIPSLACSSRQGKLCSAKCLQTFCTLLSLQLFLSCIFFLVPSLAQEDLQSVSNAHLVPKSVLPSLLYVIPLALILGHNQNIESLPIPQIFVESTWCHFARLLLFVKLS